MTFWDDNYGGTAPNPYVDRALGNTARRGDTMKYDKAAIAAVVAIAVIAVGISAGYAIADHDPSSFLRAFGCSLPK